MKKLALFLVASFLTVAVFAQQVSVRTNGNYELKIDGRGYYGNNDNVSFLNQGQHTVEVYQVSNGLFGIKRRSLVSTSSFQLRNYDVILYVDNNGQLRVSDQGNYSRRDRNYDNNDRNYDRSRSYKKKNRGYGPYNNPGKGNKYGVYKNKKNKHGDDDRYKKNRDWRDRDRDDDDD